MNQVMMQILHCNISLLRGLFPKGLFAECVNHKRQVVSIKISIKIRYNAQHQDQIKLIGGGLISFCVEIHN